MRGEEVTSDMISEEKVRREVIYCLYLVAMELINLFWDGCVMLPFLEIKIS